MLPQNYLIGTKMYMAPKRRGTRLRFPLLSDSQPLIFCFALLANFYVAAAFYVKFSAAPPQKNSIHSIHSILKIHSQQRRSPADQSKPRPLSSSASGFFVPASFRLYGIFSVKYSLLMIGILENPLYGAMLYQKQLLTYTKKEKENVTYT